MIVRILLAALAAGLFAGMAMTAAQSVKVVPLILEAEEYETAPAHESTGTETAEAAAPAAHEAGEETDGGILFGLGRLGGTLLANLVTGAGFALVLAAVAMITGKSITLANAFAWGLLAWMSVQFLPAIGLAPELPGMPAGDLTARQIWWVSTVAASAAGLWIVAFVAPLAGKIAGLALIALPHVIGAPRPVDIASDVPAHLASEYAVSALATTLFFWLVLSFAFAWCSRRFGAAE